MDRESPEKKKTRLYTEAVAAIGDGEIAKLSKESQGALKTILKLHIGLEVDNEMKAEVERDRATNAEKDKAINSKYARRLACPTNIRHGIELFPTRYLVSPDAAVIRQGELNTKIEKLLNQSSRINFLTGITRHLASISKKSDTEKEQMFKNAWKRLRKIDGGPLFRGSDRSSEINLKNSLLQLYEESDGNNAYQAWQTQLQSVWIPRSTLELSLDDHTVIKNLAFISADFMHSFFTDVGKASTNLFRTQNEVEYTIDYLKVGQIFIDTTSKHYKLCFWILYNSVQEEIKTLWKDMEKEWPNLERHERADLYCKEFSQLYNLVSELDKHGPGLRPPFDCVPEEEDYDCYVNHLSKNVNKYMGFVAKTIYKPCK